MPACARFVFLMINWEESADKNSHLARLLCKPIIKLREPCGKISNADLFVEDARLPARGRSVSDGFQGVLPLISVCVNPQTITSDRL